MQSKSRFLVIMAAALMLWQGAALAEMVQGQVTAVNPGDRSLTVQRSAAEGEQGKEISLKVPENAELRGIQTFAEVGVGDEIRAEANKPALGIGNWEARWIEKSDQAAGADQAMGADAQGRGDEASGSAADTDMPAQSATEGSLAGSAGSSSATNY
jgi:hypothetical protein